MDHVNACGVFKQGPAQVVRAPNAARCVAVFARCGFGRGDHFGHCFEGGLIAHHQDEGAFFNQGDGHNVVERVEV